MNAMTKNVKSLTTAEIKKEAFETIHATGMYGEWKALADATFEWLTSAVRRLSELEGLLNKQTGDAALIKHAGVAQRIINNQRLTFKKSVVDKIVARYEQSDTRMRELLTEKSARHLKEEK